MKCARCKREDLAETQESHDVPCYIFPGNRKQQKQYADKLGRHHLCKSCHDQYELIILKILALNILKEDLDKKIFFPPTIMGAIREECNKSNKTRNRAIKICNKLKEDYFK